VRFLPSKRPFKLPGLLGWSANFLTVAFALIVVVFYTFPVVLPVSGSNMSGSQQLSPFLKSRLTPFQITHLPWLALWQSSLLSTGSCMHANHTTDLDWLVNEQEPWESGVPVHMTNVVEIIGRIWGHIWLGGCAHNCSSIFNPSEIFAQPVVL
jgi:hypothetical protein